MNHIMGNDPIGKLLGDWSMGLNIGSILFRLTISIVIASIVGWERSNKRHAAGLRTFIVVSLGSTIAMIVDLLLIEEYHATMGLVSSAMTIGVAIISANTLLYSSKSQIKGLTTSIALCATGIIGLLIGTGSYTVVLFVSVSFVFILSVIPVIEIYLKDRSNHFEFHLELKCASCLKDFSTVIRELGLRIDGIESNPAYANSGLSVYSVSVSIVNNELKQYKTHKEIIMALSTLEYVNYIEEMK